MKTATIIRNLFFSLMASVALLTEVDAQTQERRTSGPAKTKDGGNTTTQTPAPTQDSPVPIYNPFPNDRTTNPPTPTRRPAPTQPVPSQHPTIPPPQQSEYEREYDRNYDVNGDGVISKEEKKRMKSIQKAEEKYQKDIRKAHKKNNKGQAKAAEKRREVEQRLAERARSKRDRDDD
jgi:hypothetical protein